MPLVLSLRQGQDFYVGKERFVVDHIHNDTMFRLRHVESARKFEVSDTQSTKILDDVFVSAGARQQPMLVRLAIEAPANVLVLRGDRYRNPPEHIKAGARG
jgi:hypothetical protein